MKRKNIIIIAFIVLVSMLFYKINFSPIDSNYLIPKEELIHTNIESLEVINHRADDNMVINDVEDIKNFALLLEELNTKDIGSFDYDDMTDESLYNIHITNNGRYPNTPIIVFDNSLVYKDKIIYITSELLLITQLWQTEIDK